MPKIVDHDKYRKQLLRKSFDFFAEKGYGAITMRQIAQGLSVSTGTLYHYFPSKKVLFEQLVEEISQQDVNTTIGELEETQTLQERMEVMERYMVENEDYFIKWTYILVDFYRHQDSKEMQNSSVFKRADQRYQQAIYNFFGIQDPVLLRFVMVLSEGLILQRLWGNQMTSFAEQYALMGKMLTTYLERQQTDRIPEIAIIK